MKSLRARCYLVALIVLLGAWFTVLRSRSTGPLQEARRLRQAISSRIAKPPLVPDHFLFRPDIVTTRGMAYAGTACVAEVPGVGRPILLTALHIFGPAGGMEAPIAAKDLPAAIKRVTLRGLFDKSEVVEAGDEALSLPDAAPFPTPSKAGDIAAFLATTGARLTPRPLAARTPQAEERVWLAASLLGGAPASRRLHAAVVKERDANGLVYYVFEDPELQLRATSGAPILDAAGEIVAIQVAAGKIERTHFGVATPVAKFLPSLKAALKRQAAR